MVTFANGRQHEGFNPGRGVRDPAATAHPERPQTAGGILQQAYPAAPGGGPGQGMKELGGGWAGVQWV